MCALPTPSPTESPQARHTLPEPARGCGMTWWANRYFIQETLRNMNLQDGPPRPGTPMRESCPVPPETGQYDSPDMDDPEEDLTSQANFDSKDEYTDAMGRSGWSLPAERNHRRNHAMCRERVHAKRNFHQGGSTWGQKLVFSLFREPTEMTAFPIETSGQRWKLPWPRATSPKELRSPCLRLWRVWLKTMQPT